MSGADDSVLRAMRPTWVEISLDAWRRNLRAVQARLPRGSALVPVLKADAYGHGAVRLSRIANEEGIRLIATALLEESLEIRHALPDQPLLVFGPLESSAVDLAIDRNIIMGITGPESLRIVHERVTAGGRIATVHLKLDSGMGRMGLIESDLPYAIEVLRDNPRVRLGGIYTHLATADEIDNPALQRQLERFERMLAILRAHGIEAPLTHSANSPATFRGIVREGDYARAGMLLLGGEVTEQRGSRLEPVLRWRTVIARLKQIAAGESVGYGLTWTASRPAWIATLPVGYADGYDRLLSNRADVLVRGQRAPVVGRVSMDLVTIDVTDVPGVSVGDEVVLLGKQGADEIPAEELARLTGTIAYEVFCMISSRVPRVWISGESREVGSRFNKLLVDSRP